MLWVKHIYMKEKTLNAKPTFRNKKKQKQKKRGGGGGMNRRRKNKHKRQLIQLQNRVAQIQSAPTPLSYIDEHKMKQTKTKNPLKNRTDDFLIQTAIYIYSHAHPGRHSLSLLAFLCPQPNKPPTKRPKLLVQVLHGSTGRVHHPYRSVLGRDDDSDGAGVALPGLTAGDHQHRVVGLNYTLHSSHAQCVVDATVYVLPPIVHCVYWHPAKKKNGVREGVGGRGRRAEAGGGAGMGKGHKQRGGGGREGREKWEMEGEGSRGAWQRKKKKKKEVVLKVKQNTKQKCHNQKKQRKSIEKQLFKKKKKSTEKNVC